MKSIVTFSYVDRDRDLTKGHQPEMQFPCSCGVLAVLAADRSAVAVPAAAKVLPAGPAARLRHLAPATRPHRPDGRPAPGSTFSFQCLHCPARVASTGRLPLGCGRSLPVWRLLCRSTPVRAVMAARSGPGSRFGSAEPSSTGGPAARRRD